MSAVVDEIQGVRCNFCEDGGGVFITSSDGIRCGDCGKKCVAIAPPEDHSKAQSQSEPTLTDPLDSAFEEQCVLPDLPAPEAIPDPVAETTEGAEDDELFPDAVEPPVETAVETAADEEAPVMAEQITTDADVESESTTTEDLALTCQQATVDSPPKAPETSVTLPDDKATYTKVEVENIKQSIADEMMREVESIMAQTQARNKELESELKAMQRSYEKLTLTCAQSAMEKNDKVEALEQMSQLNSQMEADLEGKLQRQERMNELLHLENERLRTAAESDQRDLKEVSTSKVELEVLVSQFQQAETEMTQQIELKELEVRKLKAEWEALKGHAEGTLEQANTEVERLSGMIRTTETATMESDIRLSKTRDELAVAHSERDDATSRCVLLEQNTREAELKVNGLEEELNKIRVQFADSEATLNEVRKSEKVSQGNATALQSDSMDLRTQLSTARVELADAKSQLSSITQKHESASQGTASASKRLQELEDQNKDLKLESYEWQKKAEGAMNSSSAGDSSEEVARLQVELADMTLQFKAKDDEKAELQKVCDELFQMVEAKGK